MLKGLQHLQAQKIFIFFLSICLTALTASLLAQFVWRQQPCNLCLAQRTMYSIGVALSFWGILSKKPHLVYQLLLFCFLIGLIISLYHLGVQYGLIADRCKTAPIANDIQVFEELLLQKRGCGAISWKLFGLPIPFFNSILFSTMAFAAHLFRKSRIVQPTNNFY